MLGDRSFALLRATARGQRRRRALHAAADEIGCKRRQPIDLIHAGTRPPRSGPRHFSPWRNGAVTYLVVIISGFGAEEPDHRHCRRCLRAHFSARPRCRACCRRCAAAACSRSHFAAASSLGMVSSKHSSRRAFTKPGRGRRRKPATQFSSGATDDYGSSLSTRSRWLYPPICRPPPRLIGEVARFLFGFLLRCPHSSVLSSTILSASSQRRSRVPGESRSNLLS
jgi:hypothetical protein